MMVDELPGLRFLFLLEPLFWALEVDELHEILVAMVVEGGALVGKPIEEGLKIRHVEVAEFLFEGPLFFEVLFGLLEFVLVDLAVADVLEVL